jgi:SUMO ligase MMS21 Smc5/6 complex component
VNARGQLTGKEYIHPVKVYSSKRNDKVDTIFSDGENFSINCDMFVKWYSEPIMEPSCKKKFRLINTIEENLNQ